MSRYRSIITIQITEISMIIFKNPVFLVYKCNIYAHYRKIFKDF